MVRYYVIWSKCSYSNTFYWPWTSGPLVYQTLTQKLLKSSNLSDVHRRVCLRSGCWHLESNATFFLNAMNENNDSRCQRTDSRWAFLWKSNWTISMSGWVFEKCSGTIESVWVRKMKWCDITSPVGTRVHPRDVHLTSYDIVLCQLWTVISDMCRYITSQGCLVFPLNGNFTAKHLANLVEPEAFTQMAYYSWAGWCHGMMSLWCNLPHPDYQEKGQQSE